MPAPRSPIASDATLKAADVHQDRLFPERSLPQHDDWPGFRETGVGQYHGCVTHDRLDGMAIASLACPGIDPDLRPHGSNRLEQRIAHDVDLLGIGSNPCGNASSVEFSLDERTCGVSNPYNEATADRPHTARLLAA